MAVVANVAANRGRCAARASARHNPARHSVLLCLQLAEDGFRNIVVATPVGGPLCVGELIHIVTAGLNGQLGSLFVHLVATIYKVALAAIKLDQIYLGRGGGTRHDCDKRQTEHAREVGL